MSNTTRRIPRVEARYYETADWDTARCSLCPQLCSIAPSRAGTCGVRTNRNGVLYADSYGKVAWMGPRESSQLPLFHYQPRAAWLSVGLKGCNMRCPFCNTAQFSQIGGRQTQAMSPQALVAEANEKQLFGISFGVNEPLIAHEYVVDTFRAARKAGLATHAETNGMWTEEPFEEIVNYTDAFTFGFKGFDETFLTTQCGGQLDIAQKNVKKALAVGKHVEVSYLILGELPGWEEQARDFGLWLANLDPLVPVLVMKTEPSFMWKDQRTSRATASQVLKILSETLEFVYLLDFHSGLTNTHCSGCGQVLVERTKEGTMLTTYSSVHCPSCGSALPYRQWGTDA